MRIQRDRGVDGFLLHVPIIAQPRRFPSSYPHHKRLYVKRDEGLRCSADFAFLDHSSPICPE
jgi:hypothetical protein